MKFHMYFFPFLLACKIAVNFMLQISTVTPGKNATKIPVEIALAAAYVKAYFTVFIKSI